MHWAYGPDAERIREQLRQLRKGRSVKKETIDKAKETRNKNGTLMKGSEHYNWKGGKSWQRFKSPEYIAWRNSVLERDSYTCQDCGRVCKKHEKGLAAHHVKPYAKFPRLRFDVDNGLTLCRECHMNLHGKALRKVMIPCACGCGTMIPNRDKYGRDRRYVNHHGSAGRRRSKSSLQWMSAIKKGRVLSDEHKEKISHGLRSSDKRIGRPPGK